ncbi:MAG: flagellar assembly protein FliH [Burkholderiales bacterium]|nr:flagellar assembly protein FliH [Burkholderiales bacterium]
MSNIVRKGELSAFQRWEMASFGDDRPASVSETQLASIAAAKASQAETDSVRENARQQGYAAGYKEAYELGLKEGRDAGYAAMEASIHVEIAALQDLANALSAQIASAGKQMGRDLLNLAIDLSQTMLKTKLELDSEAIIPIVEDAIEQLPSAQQPAQIFLHPDDADVIKKRIGDTLNEQGWRIVVDHHMERGGCKLETVQNIIDASYSTRWQRLTDAIKINASSSD